MPCHRLSTTQHFNHLRDELEQWQEEHPHASLTEREEALDQRLDVLRARMLTESAQAAHQPTACPDCGASMVRRGRNQRTLTTRSGAALPLERSYQTCPVCGVGLFPPG